MNNKSGLPSLAALLGLLAVVGYQNRDKIAEVLNQHMGQGRAPADPNAPAAPGDGGLFGGLAESVGAAAGGGGLLGGIIKGATDLAAKAGVSPDVIGGLGGVVDSFRNAGHGAAADSWVGTGPNQAVTPAQTEQALGPDLIDILVKQTGLSKEDILGRLSEVLPKAVDTMSPDGKLPAA